MRTTYADLKGMGGYNFLLRPGLLALIGVLIIMTAIKNYRLADLGNSGITSWHYYLFYAFIIWVIPLLLFPAFFALNRKFNFKTGTVSWIATHLISSLIFVLVSIFLIRLITQAAFFPTISILEPELLIRNLIAEYSFSGYLFMIIYWVFVLAVFYTNSIKEKNKISIRTNELQEQLAEVQLKMIESRLSPHFIFNTLSLINNFFRKNPIKARSFISKLKFLLEDVLNNESVHLISVQKEMAFVEEYLDIEKNRFIDRLDIQINIDENLQDILIPKFIIQTLVENSIKHAVSKTSNKSIIKIEISEKKEEIHIIVEDSGDGNTISEAKLNRMVGIGFGLESISSRIAIIYGSKPKLKLEKSVLGGLKVEITANFKKATLPAYE